MELYADRSFVGKIKHVKAGETIITPSAEFKIKADGMMMQYLDGSVEPIKQETLEKNFIPVKVEEDYESLKEQYIAAYANFTGEELNQEEDADYIFEMEKVAENNKVLG